MPIAEFELDPHLVDSAVGVELLFAPTRTEATLVRSGLAATAFYARIDKPGLVVRIRRANVVAGIQPPPWPRRIAVNYDGEPPRLVGHVRLAREEDAIDADVELRHWIASRVRLSRESPAHLFFLRLDLETAPHLMIDWTPEQMDKYFQGPSRSLADRIVPRWTRDARSGRLLAFGEIFRALNGRLRDAPFPNRQLELIRPVQLAMYQEVTEVFCRLLREELAGRVDCMGHAFDRFAAGLLRQQITPRHAQLRASESTACDADSDAIFMFAELAFIAIDSAGPAGGLPEPAQVMADFWRPHLNALVRAQEIYLARWGMERYRRMRGGFGLASERLTPDVYARITEPARALGDDPVRLRERVVASLQSLLPWQARAPDGCC